MSESHSGTLTKQQRLYELKNHAIELYMKIPKDRAPLKPTVEMIMQDMEGGRVANTAKIYANITSVRELAVKLFLDRNKERKKPKEGVNDIWGYDKMVLHDDKSDINAWLHHALGVAFAIEQFHAHANYKNPHPKPKKDGKPRVDNSNRDAREHDVQEWLVAQDNYTKYLAKITKKRTRSKRPKKHANSEVRPRPVKPAARAGWGGVPMPVVAARAPRAALSRLAIPVFPKL